MFSSSAADGQVLPVQKRKRLKLAGPPINCRSPNRPRFSPNPVVQNRRIARFRHETHSGRPSVRTIRPLPVAYPSPLRRSRRSPIALQQSAEPLIADDVTNFCQDRLVRRRVIERHVANSLVWPVPVVVPHELTNEVVAVLLAQGDSHLHLGLLPAGPSVTSRRLLTDSPESSRSVGIDRTTEQDAEFATHCGEDGYGIDPKESRYDKRTVRGAFSRDTEIRSPRFTEKTSRARGPAFFCWSLFCQVPPCFGIARASLWFGRVAHGIAKAALGPVDGLVTGVSVSPNLSTLVAVPCCDRAAMGEVPSRESRTQFLRSRSDSLTPEELGYLRLIDPTLSNSENNFHELLVAGFDGLAVEFEEDQRRFQTNSLVAVHKGVVLNKMEQVGGSHKKDVGMQPLAAKGRLWLGDGRLQQRAAAQSITAAIGPDLASVQLEHIIPCQELRQAVLLSKLLKGLLVTRIHFFARFTQLFFPTVVGNRSNPDGRTICRQLHRALRINLQQVENRPIHDKCPAVAMPHKVLEHLQVSVNGDPMV